MDSEEAESPPKPVAVAVKVLRLSGLTVELGNVDLTSSRGEDDAREEFRGV